MELLNYLEAIKKRIWLVLLIVLSTCAINWRFIHADK
jgi:uncharacterized protein involved in exopolysaccharide biosynthesis